MEGFYCYPVSDKEGHRQTERVTERSRERERERPWGSLGAFVDTFNILLIYLLYYKNSKLVNC